MVLYVLITLINKEVKIREICNRGLRVGKDWNMERICIPRV